MAQEPQVQPQSKAQTVDNVPIALTINRELFVHDGDPETPLLWYLRDDLQLTGTKYACDSGTCGACTVLVNDKATLACQMPMSKLINAEVVTVEGLADHWPGNKRPPATADERRLHPLQQAFIEHDAIQCGYCQPGQLMAAAALLARKPKPRERDLDGIGNLCRCGIYPRFRAAIQQAATVMRESST